MILEKLKKSRICRKILLIFMDFLSVINKILPKKKEQILFYDSSRDFLDDNTEAIYSWLKNNGYEKKYKFIVCVPNEKIKLPFSDYEPVGALKGVIAFLTTKYVFFSFGDFRIRPSKSQIVVNQWHATPTKRIGKLTYDHNYQKERLDNFTYLLSASDYFIKVFSTAFGCSESKIKVIGNARTDYFYSDRNTLEIVGINGNKYKKKILWMPTFRISKDNRFHDGNTVKSETGLPIVTTYETLNMLDQILIKQNILLVVKIHPMAILEKNNYENIRIVSNEDIIPKKVRLYEFIKEFDALITDYSSVYCDYIMLNRPIGFTLDDFDEYEQTRGFVFDNFIDYMPGHNIYTLEDIGNFVDDIAENRDPFLEKRLRLQPVFCKDIDGHNCERLAELVGLVADKKTTVSKEKE